MECSDFTNGGGFLYGAAELTLKVKGGCFAWKYWKGHFCMQITGVVFASIKKGWDVLSVCVLCEDLWEIFLSSSSFKETRNSNSHIYSNT